MKSEQYEVYNKATGNTISHPCDQETAQAIMDIFNAMNSIDDSYTMRPVIPHTIYKARVNPLNPGKPELLEVVAMDLSQEEARKRAWQMTMALGDDNSGYYYTARLNERYGPVRRYIQMAWGELIPDFS